MCKLLAIACLILVIQIQGSQQQQQQQYTTPVPILKQIDRHNDDGSYTYGYEAADKSFKIETKYPNGEVFGKYGYVDDQGNVREIEYGASKRGFEPAGSDINVPPPTLTNSNPYPLGPNELDDGQYREDPSVYYKDQKFNRPVAASQFSLSNHQQPRPQAAYTPAPQYNAPSPQYNAPAPRYNPPAPQFSLSNHQQSRPQAAYAPAPQYNAPSPQYNAPAPRYNPPAPQYYNASPPPPPPPAQPRYQPSAYQQPYYQPQPQPQPQSQYNGHPYNSLPAHHHPALKSLDISSGSYSLDYTGRRK